MSAGTKKPVRWTIPDVKSAPARALRPESTPAAQSSPSYPSASELLARSPEWRGWLEQALSQILRPAALAGAVALAGGCGSSATVDDLLGGGGEQASAPVFASEPAAPVTAPPATLVAAGQPYGAKPEPGGTTLVGSLPDPEPPCPLGLGGIGGVGITTTTPSPHPPALPGGIRAMPPSTPPSTPPMVRGTGIAVHVPPPATTPPRLAGRVAPTHTAPAPSIVPDPDPPAIDGDIAIVSPSEH